MSELKRKIAETDPDYEDAADQQAKRQRVLEQDGREAACKNITSIIKKEFQKEISDKEKELIQIDLRLNQARLIMDRLRACVVASYYGRANRTLSAAPSPNCSSSKVPPPNIHPTVKQFIGKAPKTDLNQPGPSTSSTSTNSLDDGSQVKDSEPTKDQTAPTKITLCVERSSASSSPTPRSLPPSKVSKPHPQHITKSSSYDDRRSRFKIKKKIVIGNISRYIPVDQRESTDMSSHKWMVYVRGHKSDPDVSGFVKKVWFFLHHSYKPNDHVEISSPPFHLTRRGWGEFPVRVQLHFVDSRNKKVDIIHHLKLDKTFTGLQKLGAETVVEVELERDFFESVNNVDDESHPPTLLSGPQQLYTSSQKLSSSSSSFSSVPSRINSPVCQAALSPDVNSSPTSITEKSAVDSESSSSTLSRKSSSCEMKEISQLNREKGKRRADECNESIERFSPLVGGKEIHSLKDKSKHILDRDKNSVDDARKLDTSWIKMETEDIVDDEVVDINVSCDNGVFRSEQSKVAGYIERVDDHSVMGIVDNEFNVTVKHEEVLDHFDGVCHFQNDDNLDVTDENIHPEEVVNFDVSGVPSIAVKEEPVDLKPNIEQIHVSILEQSYLSSQGLPRQSMESDKNSHVRSTMASVNISPNQHQQVAASSVSLLKSSTLEKMKQQQQTAKRISLLKPQAVKQEIISPLPKTQSILNPSQTPSAGVQKFTVINIAKHKGGVTALPPQTVSPNDSTKPAPQGTHVLPKSMPNLIVAPGKMKVLHQNSSTPLTPTSADSLSLSTISVSTPNRTTPKILQVVNPPHRMTSATPHQPHLVKKVSLLQPNLNVGHGSSKKIIVLKPSSSPAGMSDVFVPSANFDAHTSPLTTVSPPAAKGKKQISLLTGLVVSAAKKEQPQSQTSETVVPQNPLSNHHFNSNTSMLNMHTPHEAETQMGGSFITVAKPFHQHTPHNINILSDNGQMIVTKTAKNPHTVVSRAPPPLTPSPNISILNPPSISSPNISLLNPPSISSPNISLLNPPSISSPNISLLNPPSTSSSSYSLLNPPSSSQSLLALGSKTINPNSILAQTSTPNIVIAYPNTNTVKLEPNTFASPLESSATKCYTEVATEVRMSAIGKTKHLHRGLHQSIIHRDPVKERIWRQYEVLNQYKRTINECHKEQQSVRLHNDAIDGDVDLIPKLDPDDYPDVFSLTKAAIRLHPIVQTGVNKLTHPYCAESRDRWFSWPVGKQRASEWHRACFTLKYMKDCIKGASLFKGEKLMTTKQLVCWCRLHAFSPQTPIFPDPDMKEDRSSPVSFLPNPHPHHPPQSFTDTSDLKPRLGRIGSFINDSEDVEIILEEIAPLKVEVKEEIMDAEDELTSELPPLSDGVVFVHDWMRKRGVKFLTQDSAEERISAEVSYQVMMEFGSDILRKAFAVYSERDKSSDSLSVLDIHSALCSLPAAAFCRNSFLGKEETEDESTRSSSSR